MSDSFSITVLQAASRRLAEGFLYSLTALDLCLVTSLISCSSTPFLNIRVIVDAHNEWFVKWPLIPASFIIFDTTFFKLFTPTGLSVNQLFGVQQPLDKLYLYNTEHFGFVSRRATYFSYNQTRSLSLLTDLPYTFTLFGLCLCPTNPPWLVLLFRSSV